MPSLHRYNHKKTRKVEDKDEDKKKNGNAKHSMEFQGVCVCVFFFSNHGAKKQWKVSHSPSQTHEDEDVKEE